MYMRALLFYGMQLQSQGSKVMCFPWQAVWQAAYFSGSPESSQTHHVLCGHCLRSVSLEAEPEAGIWCTYSSWVCTSGGARRRGGSRIRGSRSWEGLLFSMVEALQHKSHPCLVSHGSKGAVLSALPGQLSGHRSARTMPCHWGYRLPMKGCLSAKSKWWPNAQHPREGWGREASGGRAAHWRSEGEQLGHQQHLLQFCSLCVRWFYLNKYYIIKNSCIQQDFDEVHRQPTIRYCRGQFPREKI